MVVRGRRAVLAGFLASLILLAILLGVVGVARVTAVLATVRPGYVAVVVAFASAWLFAWGLALRTVLSSLGVVVSPTRAALLYAGAAFANNVTPFGQAGGEPVSALLVSRSSSARYETGLAAIATLDAINVVPSVGFALLAAGYYAATVTLGTRLRTVVATLLTLAVVLLVAVSVGWRRRRAVEARVASGATTVAGALDRVAPSMAPDPDAVAGRVGSFFADVERLGTDRRRLAVAFGFSGVGWLCQIGSLLAALAAVGHPIAPVAALFVVPAANVAGFAPLPGGFGSIDATFVALLVTLTGVPAATATAAVLVHRGGVYWLPILVGGGAAAALGIDGAGGPDDPDGSGGAG